MVKILALFIGRSKVMAVRKKAWMCEIQSYPCQEMACLCLDLALAVRNKAWICGIFSNIGQIEVMLCRNFVTAAPSKVMAVGKQDHGCFNHGQPLRYCGCLTGAFGNVCAFLNILNECKRSLLCWCGHLWLSADPRTTFAAPACKLVMPVHLKILKL